MDDADAPAREGEPATALDVEAHAAVRERGLYRRRWMNGMGYMRERLGRLFSPAPRAQNERQWVIRYLDEGRGLAHISEEGLVVVVAQNLAVRRVEQPV